MIGLIKTKKQRNTIQGQIILETLNKFCTHPTVEEIYTEIRKLHPTISKATVYRNLHQLAENGEIRQVSLPGELERYDRRDDPHYHFQCTACGAISDVDLDYFEGINETVMQKYGVQVDTYEVVFRGICPKCGGDWK